MKRFSITFMIALWVCLCSVELTVAQDQKTLKALEEVNEQSRPRLAKRLEEFMAYHRSEEWDKLFKLIDMVNVKNTTLEKFTKVRSEFGWTDFVPEYASKEPPIGLEYRIYGCVTYASDQGRSFQGGTVAYFQNGDWYFTPYFLSYGTGTSPLPCKPQVRSPDLH